MRRIVIFLLSVTNASAAADTLPEGAVARVGSTRFRDDGGTDSVAFSADGKWLATESKHFAAVWEIETGKQVFRTAKEAYAPIGFARNGKIVRIVDSVKIRDFDPRSGRLIRTQLLERHAASDYHCVISPDGRFAMYPVTESIAAIVDLETGKVVQTIQGGGAEDVRAVFSRNGKYLAIGLKPQVEVHDLATGKLANSIRQSEDEMKPCAIDSDGKRLVTKPLGILGHLSIWDTPNRKILRKLAKPVELSGDAVFSSDGTRLAFSDEYLGSIRIVDVDSGKDLKELRCERHVSRLAFSPDGQTLAVARGELGVSFFDVASGTRLASSADPSGWIQEIRFIDGGKNLLLIADDITIRDWRTDRVVRRLNDARRSRLEQGRRKFGCPLVRG